MDEIFTIYDHARVYRIFRGRVQSKEYRGLTSTMCFTPRILASIVNQYCNLCRIHHELPMVKRNLVNRWTKTTIEDTVIYTEEKAIKFNEVQLIEITTEKDVFVVLYSGEKFRMMTRLDNGKMQKMCASEMKTIELSHTLSVAKTLTNMVTELPTLKQISEDMQRYCSIQEESIYSRDYYKDIVVKYDFDTLRSLSVGIDQELELLREPFRYELRQAGTY